MQAGAGAAAACGGVFFCGIVAIILISSVAGAAVIVASATGLEAAMKAGRRLRACKRQRRAAGRV